MHVAMCRLTADSAVMIAVSMIVLLIDLISPERMGTQEVNA